MTKFEEELFNKVPCKFELTTEAEYKKTTLINHFKNWHSDDEYQELFDKYSNLNDHYEKEVIRSSKLESQIIDLKSQLQQQALPVVPECVGEWIEHCKGMGYDLIAALTFKLSSTMHEELSSKILKWLGDEGNNDELFARAWLDGYTVEKLQLFYLKNKITGNVLVYDESPELSEVSELFATGGEFELENYTFTQQEINSMQTGSYEQIEVAE